jgi:hypothetical protein
MTLFKLGSEAPSHLNQQVALSDKRVIPPHRHEKRIVGALHLPLSHKGSWKWPIVQAHHLATRGFHNHLLGAHRTIKSSAGE